MSAIRKCQSDVLHRDTNYQHLRARYGVDMAPTRIGGAFTEVFVPKEGIAPKNQNRVLINVTWWCFLGGSRTYSNMESPIASVGKIKVVSIARARNIHFRRQARMWLRFTGSF
jgi:hypothetical protein